MLVKLSGGPLDGQERDLADTTQMGILYPGYSPSEQTSDPEKGFVMTATWIGGETEEEHYAQAEEEQKAAEEAQASEAPKE